MNQKLIAKIVRTKFATTSRVRARRQIVEEARLTLECADKLGESAGKPVRVPELLGVDEDMRDWSLFMILEHNSKVNPSITRAMKSLAIGEKFESTVNPKTDFNPSESPGEEQVRIFSESVDAHLQTLDSLGDLRGTEKFPHPIFGPLSAHGWNCVFGFHLRVHRKQAQEIVRIVEVEK